VPGGRRLLGVAGVRHRALATVVFDAGIDYRCHNIVPRSDPLVGGFHSDRPSTGGHMAKLRVKNIVHRHTKNIDLTRVVQSKEWDKLANACVRKSCNSCTA
jgi:hypothetical protein